MHVLGFGLALGPALGVRTTGTSDCMLTPITVSFRRAARPLGVLGTSASQAGDVGDNAIGSSLLKKIDLSDALAGESLGM